MESLLWSIIGDAGFVVSSVVPAAQALLAFRLLTGKMGTRPAIPIVALTAHAMAGDHERAVQAGCDDYHAKPVEFQRLLTQIAALLNKTSAQ